MAKILKNIIIIFLVFFISIENFSVVKAEGNDSEANTTEINENINTNDPEESKNVDDWYAKDNDISGDFTSSIGIANSETTVYAVDGSQANETIDSFVTDEAADDFNRNIEKMYSKSLISFTDASVVLKNADGFRLNGGLKSETLLSANPYFSAIGLTDSNSMIDTNLENADTSKSVYVISDSTKNSLEASAYIYVVDKDSICIIVTDENGMGIGNALVTISYEVDGKRTTRSMRTTNGNVKGIAAFDDMDTFNYCLLDISADGYQSITLLEETLNSGEKRTYSLKQCKENSVYIRCLDINGKDMLFSDTDLVLVSESFETKQIPFSVLLTATGSSSLPSTIELYSKTREKVIATFKKTSNYTISDENTGIYTIETKWMNQNISPLVEGDELTINYKDNSYEMKNVTVTNAVRDPGADNNVSMPIFNSMNNFDNDTFNKNQNTGTFASIAKSSGMLNGSFKLGSANVTIGWYPDGGFYVLTTVDIKKLSKDWGDIFEDTWDPKDRSDFCNVMQKFKQDFWDRVLNSVANNDELNPDVDDEGVVKDLTASYGGIKSQCSIFIAGKYNKKTNLWEGTLCGAFSVKWFGGRYTYYLIPVGTIVVPAYAGIEGGITGRGTLETQMAWKNGLSFDDVQLTPQGPFALRIDIMPYATGYFGLGIKGIMSGQLDLTCTLDAGFKWTPLRDDDESSFRAFLNVIFKLAVKANFLLFSVGYTLASSDWIKLIGDVEPPFFSSLLSASGDDKTYRIDLDACNEKATLETNLSDQQDGTISLASYTENEFLLSDSTLNLSNNGDITLVSDNTYADGQIQMVSTVNNTLLFRIVSIDGKTKLVYHHVYGDGKIDKKFYTVYVPNNYDVVEYSVVENKANVNAEIYEEQYKDYVYIAMVCTDSSKDTIEGQLDSSFVLGEVLDVEKNKMYCYHRFYDTREDGKLYYFFNPMPAGNRTTMTAAFKRCEVTVDENGNINADLDKAENIMFGLRNGIFGEFFQCSLGTGDLYSNGAWYNINDPVFWAVKDTSSEDCLQLRARTVTGSIYDANGKPFDVSLEKPEGYEFNEGERFITHWEMMNNMIYIISCGNLYYLDNSSGVYKFTNVVTKGALQNASSIYQFFTSGDQKLLYIAAMKSNVDDNGMVKGSKLLVYTVYTTDGISYRFANIHGPLEIEFDDVIPNNFTINYVSEYAGTSEDKGFALAFQIDNDVYLTSEETIAETADLYFWNQKSYEGLIVNDVKITNNAVSKADERISATVTFQNAGCRVAGPVRFLVQSVHTDENGEKEVETLQQVEFNLPINKWYNTGDNEGHYYKDIFAGDQITAAIFFKPSQNWKANEEYEIVVSIDPNYDYKTDSTCPVKDKEYQYCAYSGNRLSSSIATDIANNQLYLNGRMSIINNEHVVEVSVENRSYYMAQDPQIIIVPEYDDKWTEDKNGTLGSTTLLKTTFLGSQGVIDSNEEENQFVAQKYNKSMNVESLLESGAENGLQGFYVYLCDEDGIQINSTGIYFDNPYYKDITLPVQPSEDEKVNPKEIEFIVDSEIDIIFDDEESAKDIILTEEEQKLAETGKDVSVCLQTEDVILQQNEIEEIEQFLKDNKAMNESDTVELDKILLNLFKTVDGNKTQILKLDSAIGLTINLKLMDNESFVLLKVGENGYEIVDNTNNELNKYSFNVSEFNESYVLVKITSNPKKEETITNQPVSDGSINENPINEGPVVIDQNKCNVHLIVAGINIVLLIIAAVLEFVFHKLNTATGAIIAIISLVSSIMANVLGFCIMDLPVSIVSSGAIIALLLIFNKAHK